MKGVYTHSNCCFSVCRNTPAESVFAFYPPPLTLFNTKEGFPPVSIQKTAQTAAASRPLSALRHKSCALLSVARVLLPESSALSFKLHALLFKLRALLFKLRVLLFRSCALLYKASASPFKAGKYSFCKL